MPFTELIIFSVMSFFFTRMAIPVFIKLYSEAGFIRPNFRGEMIPLGIGIVFYISSAFVLTVGRFMNQINTGAHVFLFAAGVMALFGLMDDVFGTKHVSGLVGHLKKMIFNREVTTGALKALAGGCLALAVSAEINVGISDLRTLLLDALIIALSTNLINLLDLRPGRAGKGFFIVALFLAVTATNGGNLIYLMVFIGSLTAFLPRDLRAEVMMGDAGSNILGFTLGFTAATSLDLSAKIVYVVVLSVIHLLTEKLSLTRIIEKNRVLNYIDLIGRKY